MSTLRVAVAAALCLLTGCLNTANGWYLPITGATQTQTAADAYWDCVGQNWHREIQDPRSWVIPAGVGAGVAAGIAATPEEHAFMHYCTLLHGAERLGEQAGHGATSLGIKLPGQMSGGRCAPSSDELFWLDRAPLPAPSVWVRRRSDLI